MGATSKIEWTDATFNPWIGCTKVSDGCKHCYAESWTRRFGGAWGPDAPRRRTSAANWKNPIAWNRQAERDGTRRRVFCASLADVFDDHPSIDPQWRADLWRLIATTPHLDWLLLTKRPENIDRLAPVGGLLNAVWLGVTVEDQAAADKRIPILIGTPAAKRFLSCEPLIGPLVLDLNGIDWVIAGGESGPNARPMDEAWIRSLRDQCAAAGVPFFFKQKIENGRKISLPDLDGRTWSEVPK